MKIKFLFLALLISLSIQAQLVQQNSQLAPRPASCASVTEAQLGQCFADYVQDFIYNHFNYQIRPRIHPSRPILPFCLRLLKVAVARFYL